MSSTANDITEAGSRVPVMRNFVIVGREGGSAPGLTFLFPFHRGLGIARGDRRGAVQAVKCHDRPANARSSLGDVSGLGGNDASMMSVTWSFRSTCVRTTLPLECSTSRPRTGTTRNGSTSPPIALLSVVIPSHIATWWHCSRYMHLT